MIYTRPHLPLACVAIAVLAGILIVGCSGRRSEQFRQQGDTYFRLQRYTEAEEAYQNAAQANPENGLARLGLGRCMVVAGRTEEALSSFQECTRIAPHIELAYLEAANLLFAQGNYEEAIATAQRLEEVNPELGGVLDAGLALRSGRQTDALTSLVALRDRFPESLLVRTHHASALLRAGLPREAETELKTVLDNEEAETIGANILLVQALGAQGRIDEIIDGQEALEARSPDQSMILAYAFLLEGREHEGATLIRGALAQDPASGWASFVLGSHLSKRGQREEGTLRLQTAAYALPWEPLLMHRFPADQGQRVLASSATSAEARPGERIVAPTPVATSTEDWQSLWQKVSLRRLLAERESFSSQKGDHLRETLVLAAWFRGDGALAKELVKDLPGNSPLNGYLKAMLDGEPEKAVEALAPWNKQEGDLQLLAMNATGYAMGVAAARNQAAQVLSMCAERYPENGVSLFNLAQILNDSGSPQIAVQVLRRLSALFPDSLDAQLLIFQLLREAGLHKEAREAAEVIFALFPDSRESTLVICQTYIDVNRFAEARPIVEARLLLDSGDPEMRFLQASILFREGRVGESLKVLEETTSPGTMTPQIAALTALGHAAAQDWHRVVDLAEPGEPASMAPATRFILAAAFTALDKKDSAAAVLTRSDKDEAWGGRVGVMILSALGHSSIVLTDAEVPFSKALAANTSALVDFASGIAYQQAMLHDAAYQAFQRVDSALSLDNDYLLGFQFHSLPGVGSIEDIGREAWALAESHATRPRGWLQCAVLLRSLGDVEGEGAALDMAAKAAPDDSLVILQRGDFFGRQKDIEKALTEYRRLLQLLPDDPVGNNNLAYNLLLTNGNIDEALAAAQLAAKGLPNNPRVLHTLGVAQMRAGDLTQSRISLLSALESLPGDTAILFDCGKVLIALGDTVTGRQHIENALSSARILGLTFDQKSEAEEILNGLIVAQTTPEPESEK